MSENKFSEIISETRRRRSISQKQAALELGISQAQLSHYEKGIRECGLDFLVKIADYYGVTTDYLLGHSTTKNARTASAQRHRSLVRAMETVLLLAERTDDEKLQLSISDYIKKSLYTVIKLFDRICRDLEFSGDDTDISLVHGLAEVDFTKAYRAALDQKDNEISLHLSSLEHLMRIVNEVETEIFSEEEV